MGETYFKKYLVGKPVAKINLKNLCKYGRVIIIKYNKIKGVRGEMDSTGSK